jgi:hypothetical protein
MAGAWVCTRWYLNCVCGFSGDWVEEVESDSGSNVGGGDFGQ